MPPKSAAKFAETYDSVNISQGLSWPWRAMQGRGSVAWALLATGETASNLQKEEEDDKLLETDRKR